MASLKRLVRFRLRTLLVVFTATAVWLAFHVHSARLQQESVAAIRKYGGWVRYDYQFPSGEYSHSDFDVKARSGVPAWLLDACGVDMFHSVVQVSLNYSEDSGVRQENHNPTDEALQYLPGLRQLRVLLLSDSQASDSSLRHLASLTKLQRLYMWDVRDVTDAGVAQLRPLKDLRYIHISYSQITDQSLELFSRLPRLEGLSLQFNQFTDAGLQHMAKAAGLQSLWVCGRDDRPNRITDAGLECLDDLENLTDLGIQNTEVTAAGVAAFLRAVPGCKIHQ